MRPSSWLFSKHPRCTTCRWPCRITYELHGMCIGIGFGLFSRLQWYSLESLDFEFLFCLIAYLRGLVTGESLNSGGSSCAGPSPGCMVCTLKVHVTCLDVCQAHFLSRLLVCWGERDSSKLQTLLVLACTDCGCCRPDVSIGCSLGPRRPLLYIG